MKGMSILPGKVERALTKVLGHESALSDEEAAYRRLIAKGFRPAGIIDVGAYQGDWTRLAHRLFPDAPILMVEAQEGKAAGLRAICTELENVSFASAVLGSTAGREVTFYEMETGSSYFPEQSNAPRKERTYVTRTLDELAQGFAAPLFLKVDVQGAELEILAGGGETLSRCELVQLEVALLPYNKGAPTMLEVLNAMDSKGLVPLDISGFSRPNGVDLVQVDILFAQRGSALRPEFISFDHFAPATPEG
jgi:FkbM family methyltransferase